jgi:hypothetical protein
MQFISDDPVNKHPVRFDMAISTILVIPLQWMIMKILRQGGSFNEQG